jgi:hypothetical protein
MEVIKETKVQLNTSKDYALFYLKELGFSVFALQNPDVGNELEIKKRKSPAVPSWQDYMKTPASEEQVNKWFEEANSNYNIAAVTGYVSKMIAIDVDGQTAAKRIEENISSMSTNLRVALQNTMVNKSGSGGLHIIFRLEDEFVKDIGSKDIWKNREAHSEIRIQGNDHYIVMPPSRHPNGNHYEWNGKKPMLLTMKELEEFIRLIATDSKTGIPLSRSGKISPAATTTTLNDTTATESNPELAAPAVQEETLQELLELIKPYYLDGSRNEMILCLSGFMRKDGEFTINDVKKFFIMLCSWSKQYKYPDEDLQKALQTVEETYKKTTDVITGRSGLHNLLVGSYDNEGDNEEFKARAEAYSKIFEVITKNSKTNKNGDGKLPDGCIVMEPIDHHSKTYAAVVSKDRYLDKATGGIRPIRAIQQIQMEWNEEKNKWVDNFKSIILNAIPIAPIEIIEDPLFELVKYKIVFEYVGTNNMIKTEIVGPYTKDELRDYLVQQTPWVFKERLLTDTLNHIIAGYNRKQDMVIAKTEAETEGLIWSHTDKKLVLSQRKIYKPTPEEARQCIEVIHELQQEFYPAIKDPERKRFAHILKIGIAAPVDFARRQNGAVGSHGLIPRQDLSGWPFSGKSYGYAGLALRMYRLPLHGTSKYVIGAGSIETEARFIEQTKWTTMPVIFNDADFLTYWEDDNKAKRILPLIKNAVEMTNPRDILTHDSKRRNLPSCAYTMFTHNSGLITEDGFIRRSTGYEFTKNDEKTPEQRARYEAFFYKHAHTFGFLGDFVTWYYLEHPGVLFNDWLSMAKTILQAFYEYAGFTKEEETPKWLLHEVVQSATSQEALAEDRASGIITTLHDLTLNQGWPRIKMEGARWIATNLRHTLNNTKELDSVIGADKEAIDDVLITATIEEKIQALIALNTLPNFRWHPEKEVCITAGIVSELRKRGITRVSLKQIPSYCREFKYDEHVRFGGRTSNKNKVLTIKLEQFAGLINLKGEEEERQTTLETEISS